MAELPQSLYLQHQHSRPMAAAADMEAAGTAVEATAAADITAADMEIGVIMADGITTMDGMAADGMADMADGAMAQVSLMSM